MKNTFIRFLVSSVLVGLCCVLNADDHLQNEQADTFTPCSITPSDLWSLPVTSSDVIPVNITFFILDVVEIDERNHQFTLDFVLSLSWQDPRLEPIVTTSKGCSTRLSEIWHPHFIFINSAESFDNYDGVADIYSGGNVVYTKRFTRDFRSTMDLHRFPFDEQILSIELASLYYGPNQITFNSDESEIGILEGANISGWELGELTSTKSIQSIIALESSHSNLTFSIHVKRLSASHFWRLIFPLILIVLMSWSVFWLDPSQLDAQITVATGAIFSLMAFLVSLSDILPKVSYLSVANKLVIASIILVFAALGEAVITGVLAQNNRRYLALSIDQSGRWVYLLLILMLVLSIL